MESLYKPEEQRDCALWVSTAVLEVGVDLPLIKGVVIFPHSKSLSSMIQEAGRPVRGRDEHGWAIVYVTKADIKDAEEYLESGETLDPRLLTRRDTPIVELPEEATGSTAEDHAETSSEDEEPDVGSANVDVDGDEDGDDVPAVAEVEHPSDTADTTKKTAGEVKKKKPDGYLAPPGKRRCTSLRLVVAAYLRRYCISRQINWIYDNPGKWRDCGRCSTCVVRVIPKPRPLPIKPSPPPPPPDVLKPKAPKWTIPSPAERRWIAEHLSVAARQMWTDGPYHKDMLMVSSSSFLPRPMIDRVTKDFHLVISKNILESRMSGWRYWRDYGTSVWDVVQRLGEELRIKIDHRHEEGLRKLAEKRVRDKLKSAGLAHVKKVTLHLSARPPAVPAALPPPITRKHAGSVTSADTPSPAKKARTRGPLRKQPLTVSVSLYYICHSVNKVLGTVEQLVSHVTGYKFAQREGEPGWVV